MKKYFHDYLCYRKNVVEWIIVEYSKRMLYIKSMKAMKKTVIESGKI